MRLCAENPAGRTRRKPPNMDVWGAFCWSGSPIDGTPLRTLPAHSWTSLWTTIFWTPRSWAPQASRMTLKPTTGATRCPPGVRSTCGGSVGARGALGGCLGRSWAALLLNFSIVDLLAAFLPGVSFTRKVRFFIHSEGGSGRADGGRVPRGRGSCPLACPRPLLSPSPFSTRFVRGR